MRNPHSWAVAMVALPFVAVRRERDWSLSQQCLIRAAVGDDTIANWDTCHSNRDEGAAARSRLLARSQVVVQFS